MEKLRSPSSKKCTVPNCIINEGKLTKSPPIEKIKKSSWTERYFVLIKFKFPSIEEVPSPKNDGSSGSKTKIQGRKKTINDKQNSCYCLGYWNSEDHRRKGAKPIRMVNLDSCSVESYENPFWQLKYPFMMSLKTPKREFLLCANSAEEKSSWLSSLKIATENLEPYKGADENLNEPAGAINRIDPLYQTLNEILSKARRFSASAVSTRTNDSGYESISSRNGSRPTSVIGDFHGPLLSISDMSKRSSMDDTALSTLQDRRCSVKSEISCIEELLPSHKETEDANESSEEEEGYVDMFSEDFLKQLSAERKKTDDFETFGNLNPSNDNLKQRSSSLPPPPIPARSPIPHIPVLHKQEEVIKENLSDDSLPRCSSLTASKKLVLGDVNIELPKHCTVKYGDNDMVTIVTQTHELTICIRRKK